MKRDYGRTTITVPMELKERMKKARALVNWSSVACDAFEEKLTELGPIDEITSVEAAIKRMKSLPAGAESMTEDCQSGKEAGVQWALNFARPEQLRRIEQFREQVSDQDWEPLMRSREGCRELAKCIEPFPGPGAARGPKDGGNRGRQKSPRRYRPRRHDGHPEGGPGSEKEIWRSILDRRPDHPGFFLGFAEGALEIWEQIRDQF